MRKRGKSLDKLNRVMKMLIAQQPLPHQLRDHALAGNWVGYRECHIEPDWLLIYRLESPMILFARTGTHADLFQ
jgi:mRNA interferase YafQ